MKRSSPHLLPIIILLALLLPASVSARPAVAGGPQSYSQAFGGTALDFGITCDTFKVLANYAGQRTYVNDYDTNGARLRESRHIRFTGILYNARTGKSVPYHGNFLRLYDAQTQTAAFVGLLSEAVAPDGRVVLLERGFQITDESRPTYPVLYQKGTFDKEAGRTQLLCTALQ